MENTSGQHPSVVRIDRDDMRVTVRLTAGFYDSYRVLTFLSDASTQSIASRAGATFVPTLDEAPAPGDRDLSSSAREPVFTIVNGPTGQRNPQRQGIESALAGEGDPLDIFRSSHVCRDAGDPTDCSVFYSPLWDVYRMVWTDAAVEAGARRRLTSHEAVIDSFLAGDLQSATPAGPTNPLLANVPAAGAAVNASIVDLQRPDDG